jgi:hypothetical protein
MTWIKTISRDEATSPLKECYEAVDAMYPPEYDDEVPALVGPDGRSDSVVASHSLIPEVLRHAFATHVLLLSPDLPLTRRQQEMISTVVSALNRCKY